MDSKSNILVHSKMNFMHFLQLRFRIYLTLLRNWTVSLSRVWVSLSSLHNLWMLQTKYKSLLMKTCICLLGRIIYLRESGEVVITTDMIGLRKIEVLWLFAFVASYKTQYDHVIFLKRFRLLSPLFDIHFKLESADTCLSLLNLEAYVLQ